MVSSGTRKITGFNLIEILSLRVENILHLLQLDFLSRSRDEPLCLQVVLLRREFQLLYHPDFFRQLLPDNLPASNHTV